LDIYIGELLLEDANGPENALLLKAGDVVLSDEGTVTKISNQSKARGELPSQF
jgi:hypothetical protein